MGLWHMCQFLKFFHISAGVSHTISSESNLKPLASCILITRKDVKRHNKLLFESPSHLSNLQNIQEGRISSPFLR